MTPQELKALDRRLNSFLEDLLAPMGRSERRHWARLYIEGLLLDGDRKSIEPMASRIPAADVQALRQFVGQSPWTVEEVQRQLALKVVDLLSDPEVWILDDTSFPKAGRHSVGVARQYCGALGKVANCQVAVTLHWSSGEASCPLGWRLYVPEAWFEDSERASEVKLPTGLSFRSKPELALELIDEVLNWGVPALPVVADSFMETRARFDSSCGSGNSVMCWGWNRRLRFGWKIPTGPCHRRNPPVAPENMCLRICCPRPGICRPWPSSCRLRPGRT
jgi:SRSO17 transposase